ncbi:MAG: recombinase family protein [Chloroflexi bacterium]|nr:recombinase family protein [Chloroflexota bacterium]
MAVWAHAQYVDTPWRTMGKKRKLAAIYGRVSTRDQNLETQLVPVRKYVRRVRWKLFREYTDFGISGAERSRPGLDGLMQDARQGRFNVLVVWKLDRLGRSLQHLIRVVNDLNDNGKYFMSLQENSDSRFIYYGFNCTPRFRSIENVSMKDIVNC